MKSKLAGLVWLAWGASLLGACSTHSTPPSPDTSLPAVTAAPKTAARVTAPAIEVAVLRIAAREDPLWPGFDPHPIPLAIYDGQQTWLFRHPKPPAGFAPSPDVEGASVMPGRFEAMTANTSTDIGGTTTATLLVDTAKPRTNDDWAAVALHESFHVYQRTHHPEWRGNEADLFSYPVDNVDALALRRLETRYLRAALDAKDPKHVDCWLRGALTLREQRYAKIGETYAAYERGTELNEGLAAYVELRAKQRYDVDLPVVDYPPSQVRQRAYATGPALALLLDRHASGWQATLEQGDKRALDQVLLDRVGREGEVCVPSLSDAQSPDIKAEVAKARQDVAALEGERTRQLDAFRALPGWRLIIEAPADKPLWPQGFDPLNVQNLGQARVVHTRYLKLGNDNGSVEMLKGQALTEGAGGDALFKGVVRVEIGGLSQPKVMRVEGGIRLVGEWIDAKFSYALANAHGRTIAVELR